MEHCLFFRLMCLFFRRGRIFFWLAISLVCNVLRCLVCDLQK